MRKLPLQSGTARKQNVTRITPLRCTGGPCAKRGAEAPRTGAGRRDGQRERGPMGAAVARPGPDISGKCRLSPS